MDFSGWCGKRFSTCSRRSQIRLTLFFPPRRTRWFVNRSSACWFSICLVCSSRERICQTIPRQSLLRLCQRSRRWLRIWTTVIRCCTFWIRIRFGLSSRIRIMTYLSWTRRNEAWLLVSLIGKNQIWFQVFNLIFSCNLGPSNSVAGYLTQAPNKKIEVVMTPPPVDRDDFTGYPTEEP